MAVAAVNLGENIAQALVTFRTEGDQAAAADDLVATINQRTFLGEIVDGIARVEHVGGLANGCRRAGPVQRVTRGDHDFDFVVFLLGEVEEDRIPARLTGENFGHVSLEEIQRQSETCAHRLRISGHAHVIFENQGQRRIINVFGFDLFNLGGR